MAQGYARGTHIPIRFHNGKLLVWIKTGTEHRLPYYQLGIRTSKSHATTIKK